MVAALGYAQSMHLELTTEQEDAREQAAAFARELVAPAAADIDATGEFPVALLREAATRGYLGMLARASSAGSAQTTSATRWRSKPSRGPARRWP